MGQNQNGIATVILRPAVVYGAHDHTDRLAYWVWRASNAKPFVLPDDGLTIVRRTYAPDLASAFLAASNSGAAPGNAYNIADTDPLNLRDTLFYLGRHLDTKPLEFAVSVPSTRLLQEKVAPGVDVPLWTPQRNILVDTFKARRDLDYVSTPPPTALGQSADTFLSEKRGPSVGLSLDAENKLVGKLGVFKSV
jgi:2'-hydroxyisoflavone reductase